MDRTEILLSKVDTLSRIDAGALGTSINLRAAVTTTFNNLLQFLLEEYPTSISAEDARQLQPQLSERLCRGLQAPTREILERLDERLVPVLVIRWLIHDRNLHLAMSDMTPEWSRFCTEYMALFPRIEEALAA
jgi:hypothetical protein